MSKELITEREYLSLRLRKNWKEVVDDYTLERGLEDVFMSNTEFESIEKFIVTNEGLSEFFHDFAVHGDIYLGTTQQKIATGYFSSLNLLVGRELMSNNGRRILSAKGKAFLLEYGRRNYSRS